VDNSSLISKPLQEQLLRIEEKPHQPSDNSRSLEFITKDLFVALQNQANKKSVRENDKKQAHDSLKGIQMGCKR
jgi:hypothetical protein